MEKWLFQKRRQENEADYLNNPITANFPIWEKIAIHAFETSTKTKKEKAMPDKSL